MKSPWTKNPESNHIGEVQQHDRGRIVTVSDGAGWSVTVSNWGLGGGLIIMAPRNSRPLNNIIHTVIAGHP